jgi:hypothetical protein
MSPVSRNSRGSRGGRRTRSRRPSAAQDALFNAAEPTRDDLFESMFTTLRGLELERDPLEAEIVISQLLGTIWTFPQRVDDGEMEDLFARELTQYALEQETPLALAVLRTLVVLAPGASARVVAATGAESLHARGVREPRWSKPVGSFEMGSCWAWEDVYGDQLSVACGFAYGHRNFAVVALVDRNLGGIVKDAFIVDRVEETIRKIHKEVLRSGLLTLREVEPAWARAVLERAFALTEAVASTPVVEQFAQWRALVLSRVRALPPSRELPPDPAPPTVNQRRALVKTFLSSPEGVALPDRPAAEHLATMIVDYGSDYDFGAPERVSPAKWDVLLLRWLPRKAMLDAAERAALPHVVRAWSTWAAKRSKLSPAARTDLGGAMEEILAAFDKEYDDPTNFGPARLFLQGLDEFGSMDDLSDVLERRTFATPFYGTRVGEWDFPQLNPADPADLWLLVLGEHPEYHHLASRGPAGEITLTEVAASRHLSLHAAVARMVWDGEPRQVWDAARTLTAVGLDRSTVLHVLTEALRPHTANLADAEAEIDVVSYVESLAGVTAEARQATKGARKRAAKRAPTRKSAPRGRYQIKVSLRGAKPPIWRRLVVPAAVMLPDLHEIIQTAMGWQNSHLHMFEVGEARYGVPDDDDLLDFRDERRVTLRDIAPAVGNRIRYMYDFGDGWEHDIIVEKVIDEPASSAAVCLGGRRACPPEDCGGIGGYERLLEVLADPTDEEYEHLLDWVGGEPIDPADFDLADVNDALSGLRLRVGSHRTPRPGS